MIRVTITRTDVGEWTGEHERPSAAYARALVQAYPDATLEPIDALRKLWLGAIGEWREFERDGIECSRVTCTNEAQSIHVTIERAA